MYSLHDNSGSFILMEQEAGSAYVVTNTELDRETRANYTLDVSNVFLLQGLDEAQTATGYKYNGCFSYFCICCIRPVCSGGARVN